MAKSVKNIATEKENTSGTVELRAATLPHRQQLPDTRHSVTHRFNVNGHVGYMTVGLYEDGRPGELFVNMAKEGSTISGLMDTVGILTSLSLQYGVSVETLANKFDRMRFEPSGWTPNEEIGEATSVIDYVFRWLGINFSDSYRDEHRAKLKVVRGEHHE